MEFHIDMRVDSGNAFAGALDLERADVGRRMHHLSLQVGEADLIVVDKAERTNPGGRQIFNDRRSQPASADAQDPRGLELVLARAANVPEQDMSAVALEFDVRKQGSLLRPAPRLKWLRRPISGPPPRSFRLLQKSTRWGRGLPD